MNRLRRMDQHLTAARPGAASAIVFAIALLVRVGFALWLPNDILWIDGQRYVRIAESLLGGQGFGSLEMNKMAVPAQPLLIAAFKALFDGSYLMVRVGFAVLGSATCVVAYRWALCCSAQRLAGRSDPRRLPSACLYLRVVRGTANRLRVAGRRCVCLPLSLPRGAATVDFAGGRALFGWSALAVPTVLPFLCWVTVWFVLIEPCNFAWRGSIAAFSLGVLIAMSPWVVRNYVTYGDPVLVNLAGGENFWKANSSTYFEHGKMAVALPCEPGTGGQDDCAQLARLQAEAAKLGLTENEAIVYADQAAWQGGMTYIRDNPLQFLQLTGRKLLTLFSPRPDAASSAAADGSTLQRWVLSLTYVPVLILGLAGIVLQRRRWRQLFPAYADLVTLTVLYSVFVPTIRYRLPIDFLLVLFTADRLIAALNRHRTASQAEPRRAPVELLPSEVLSGTKSPF